RLRVGQLQAREGPVPRREVHAEGHRLRRGCRSRGQGRRLGRLLLQPRRPPARPRPRLGLAAAGAAGIERVVELLEEEMKEVMGLLGVTSLAQLDKSYIGAAMPTNLPHVHSAFPLLNLEDPGY